MNMTTEGTDDFAAQWAAAEKQAEAKEKGANVREAKEQGSQQAEVEASAEGEGESWGQEQKAPSDASVADDADGADNAKAEPAESDDENAEPSEAAQDRKRARLEALAKELGYKLDGETVGVDERVKFREERRKSREALRAERDAWDAERAKADEEFKAKGEKQRQLEAAIEAVDVEAIARLTGFDSWAQLNQHFLRQKASPEAKQLDALKRQMAERDAAEKRAAQERGQREAQARQERERRQYFEEVQADLEDSEDESVRALGKVEGFKEVILMQEQQEFDPNLKQTITRAEAIKRAKAEAFKQYQALHAVFGKGEPAASDAAPAGASPRRVAGKPANPKAKLPEKNLGLDKLDTTTQAGEKEWFEQAAALMQKGLAD